MKNVKLDH